MRDEVKRVPCSTNVSRGRALWDRRHATSRQDGRSESELLPTEWWETGWRKTSADRGRWWRAALLLGQEAIGRANMLVSHVCRWLRSHNVHRLRPHDLVLRRQRFHSQPVQVVMPCSCASIGSRSCHLRDSGEDESNVSSEMFVGPSAQTTRCEMSVLAAYLLPSPNVMGCSLGVAAAAQPRSVAIICSPA